ncbi:MAG: N-formylglutamate amidohydrolase [Deltaproteobacteria bacterium]|jgi:predicted N-formylglutamate amidohydrolase|nr:N-formylglutamate amidohydrolase [Deltaproteobacteria bacterium]
MKLVLSCEHGGNRVPRRYAGLFAGCEKVLASHRGWDPGALWLAKRLARAFDAPLHATTVTRLLVDTNRSEHHRGLFSPWSAPMSREERDLVLDRHYRAHRGALERRLRGLTEAGASVLHLAVHSFTPHWQGRVRHCDIGLLYDPQRKAERALCEQWQKLLLARSPGLRVRRNFPYRGAADGLTTHLRRQLPARTYLGVELELNQRSIARAGARRRDLAQRIESSLRTLLAEA